MLITCLQLGFGQWWLSPYCVCISPMQHTSTSAHKSVVDLKVSALGQGLQDLLTCHRQVGKASFTGHYLPGLWREHMSQALPAWSPVFKFTGIFPPVTFWFHTPWKRSRVQTCTGVLCDTKVCVHNNNLIFVITCIFKCSILILYEISNHSSHVIKCKMHICDLSDWLFCWDSVNTFKIFQ